MKPFTPQQVLQMGYDCGLTHVDQVYSMILGHYDCFFRIQFLDHDINEFVRVLVDAGFITFYMGKGTWVDATITEHAVRLGITLTELELPEPTDEPFEELFDEPLH